MIHIYILLYRVENVFFLPFTYDIYIALRVKVFFLGCKILTTIIIQKCVCEEILDHWD